MRLVTWIGLDGGNKVGRVVKLYMRDIRRTMFDGNSPTTVECVLVKHSHTGELEFVPESKLSDYPREPIPQP